MLVLSRKAEESMFIGDDIKITVLDIRGGQVRIGITAPQDIKIHREEVYDRINQEGWRSDLEKRVMKIQNTYTLWTVH